MSNFVVARRVRLLYTTALLENLHSSQNLQPSLPDSWGHTPKRPDPDHTGMFNTSDLEHNACLGCLGAKYLPRLKSQGCPAWRSRDSCTLVPQCVEFRLEVSNGPDFHKKFCTFLQFQVHQFQSRFKFVFFLQLIFSPSDCCFLQILAHGCT